MTKIYPETVEIMAPIAEVPRVEGEASRNDETSRTARVPRTMTREVLENLAYSVPKFDGKLEEWLIFRHFYMNRVHMVNEFTDTEKLLFLRHCVVGELGEQVARIGLSGANYSCAWAMIQGKFENKERELKEKHMSLILEIPEMGEESVDGLLCLIESSRKNLQCLRMINVKIPHDFVVVSLAKKLDPLTQFEWKIAAKDWEPTVEEMLDYLMRKVYYLREINRIVEQKRQRGEEADACKFCKCPDHYTHQCFMFMEWSVEDRIKWVEDSDLCKKCLRDHYSSDCKFRNCYKCNQEHSILLHQETPLNPYPQVLMARRLANIHLNRPSDGGTSDEGISESGDSQSSQEENYEYRPESEVQTEQEVQVEQQVQIMQEEHIAQDAQIVQEVQIVQEAHIAEEAQIEHEVQIEHYIDHEGVFRGHEDILSPEVSSSEKQINNDAQYHVHYNTVPPGPGIVEEQSKEIHVGVSQRESYQMHSSVSIQENQNGISHEDGYQDQIVVPHEATCQGDNNFAPPETANQKEQLQDAQGNMCQSGQIVVPLEAAVEEKQDMGLHLGACQESQNVLSPEIEDENEPEITIICQKTQNLELQPVAYQEPSFESQVDVCEQGGQNILVPGMVYQQAQYVAPPEVAYQVERQNVMSHTMVYPQVQYVVPHEEPYQIAEQEIPPPEMVYQPMQYVCSHMAPYQIEGQMMMPSGMMYPQGQYVVPQEEVYQQEEQSMVLPPGVVYQPVQYMEPQIVEQDQAARQEPILYGMPYYATTQPLQQQQNINVMQQHAMRQQHAMQQQQVIQQQQQQQQRIIQQQHAIQQQVMQQQHVIHQQQQMIQQQQQQQHVIRHAQRPIRQERVVIQQAGNIVNQQEGNDEQQGANVLQQEQNDGNQAENDVRVAGRLRPDAEPFEPTGPNGRTAAGTDRELFVLASGGEVYILSKLNGNAQEFTPAGNQPNGQHITGEVKSKVKQYLSEVVALLV